MVTAATKRIRRDQLKPGENLCDHCTGKCCRYFALPIDTPVTWKDFDHVRWYMLHGPVTMFVEDDVWYLTVHFDCKALLPDNRCGIYHERPGICRAYTTDECEYDDDAVYDKLFETPEQLWEYAETILPPRKTKTERSTSLPMLNGV